MPYLWSLSSNLIKRFRIVEYDKVSLITCYGVPHQVFYECDQLCFARSLTTQAVLEIVQQIILVHVGDYICSNNMLKHFAYATGY